MSSRLALPATSRAHALLERDAIRPPSSASGDAPTVASAGFIGPRGIGNDYLTGTSTADTILAGAGDDTVDGLGGNDTLYGEAGNDTLRGSGGDDSLVGADGNDTLRGGLDNDRLFGGNGLDVLYGEWGNDFLSAGNDPGLVFGGTDNDSLYGGTADDTLFGEDGNDLLSGSDANDSLEGGLGIDTLFGGAGHDTLIGGASGTAVTGVEVLNGEAGDDQIIASDTGSSMNGGLGEDALLGSNAADILDGGAGVDTLRGGLGNDFYYIDAPGDVVIEAPNAGIDTLATSLGTTTLDTNFENLVLLSTANVDGTGNAADNVIYAGSGNNVLDGAGGINTVSFGYATAGVTVSLAIVGAQATGGSGTDTLIAFQHLTGSSYNDSLTGDAMANTMRGNAGNDTVVGADGNDILYGGDGNDVLGGGEGNDTLNGEAGNDTLFGSGGNDFLSGGLGFDMVSFANATAAVTANLISQGSSQNTQGGGLDVLYEVEGVIGSAFNDTLSGGYTANRIEGGAGADTIYGHQGADTLVGGAGADLFQYKLVTDSWTSATDTIVDFVPGEDRIDLSQIDANVVVSGNGAFTFIGGAAFDADASGQLRYEAGVIYGSNDADSDAELVIVLTGAPAVSAADFIL